MAQNLSFTEQEREALISRLADELPVLRLKIGLSQDELANLLGISRQTYSTIETKRRKMMWSTYLSLVLIFYHNEQTRDFITRAGLLPQKLFQITGGDTGDILSEFVKMENGDIRNYLDAQAIHAIETVILMEYARCNNMSGDEVIKAFDGHKLARVTDQDLRARIALQRIRNAAEFRDQ